MLQDKKPIQEPKRDRGHHEQVHRRNGIGMIVKKDLPALRRRPPSPRHVFRYRGLADIDAKLEQFAVDPRGSPQRVSDAHLTNKLANLRRCPRSATTRSRFPAPPRSKASAMPTDDRFRLEDFQRIQHYRNQPIEPRKHQSIDIADGHPVWRLASQHIELMSKDEDLGLQRGARPEQSEHGAADQPEEIAHGNDYQPIR